MERTTHWPAVLVCVAAGMALGFLWYGALFQQQWMAGNGFTMEGEKMFKNGVEVPMTMTPMLINTIVMLVYALLINWLLGLTKAASAADGIKVGAIIGAIMALGVYVGNLFAANPASLSFVDGSYSFVLYVVMGAILGGWQKRAVQGA